MNRFVTIVLGCLCVVGTSAAAAPAAMTTPWVISGSGGQMLGGGASGSLDDIAGPCAASRMSTRGLSFLRASSHPTWVLDVMLDLVPWTLGGSIDLPAAVTANPVRWVSGGGGAFTAGVAQSVGSAVIGSVDDYSDLWSDARGADGGVRKVAREDGSNDDLADLDFAEGGRLREHDRGDLPVQEPHEDRAGDRYYDLR